MHSKRCPDLSVVVLCYRSGEYARAFHKKVVDILKRNALDYEIVLVGNYFPNKNDDTPRIVKEISDSSERTVCVVKEKINLKETGMSWDMRSGFEAATGNAILVIDGDGQMPPEDIPDLYKKLTAENLDLCKGKRTIRGDGAYRKFISSVFNGIMQLLFPGIVSDDINGKPKIFTREAYRKLNLESNDWFVDAEIMIKASLNHFRIGEMEVVFEQNPERSSFISFKANIEFLKNIILWRLKTLGFPDQKFHPGSK